MGEPWLDIQLVAIGRKATISLLYWTPVWAWSAFFLLVTDASFIQGNATSWVQPPLGMWPSPISLAKTIQGWADDPKQTNHNQFYDFFPRTMGKRMGEAGWLAGRGEACCCWWPFLLLFAREDDRAQQPPMATWDHLDAAIHPTVGF